MSVEHVPYPQNSIGSEWRKGDPYKSAKSLRRGVLHDYWGVLWANRRLNKRKGWGLSRAQIRSRTLQRVLGIYRDWANQIAPHTAPNDEITAWLASELQRYLFADKTFPKDSRGRMKGYDWTVPQGLKRAVTQAVETVRACEPCMAPPPA